jgi:glycine/D-amino acid oxidase-like deaminating enzyme
MAGIQLDIVPRRGQILVSEPLPPLVRGRLFGARYLMSKLAKPSAGAGGGSGYLSGMVLGQQASGNFLIGGTREFVGFDQSTTYDGIADLAQQAAELMPALRDMQIIRVFAGLRPSPPSGLPTIQRYSEPEGFIVASGHEGDGICLAPVTGEIVAEIAAGHVSDYHEYLDRLNENDLTTKTRSHQVS